MSDLVERLRDPKKEGACWCCQEAADEIERLEDRLEVYDSTGKVRLPEDCDGIACRDETIKMLDEQRKSQSAENADAQAKEAFALGKLEETLKIEGELRAEIKRLEALDKDWLRASEQWVAENSRLEALVHRLQATSMDQAKSGEKLQEKLDMAEVVIDELERVSTEQKRDLFGEIKEGLEVNTLR